MTAGFLESQCDPGCRPGWSAASDDPGVFAGPSRYAGAGCKRPSLLHDTWRALLPPMFRDVGPCNVSFSTSDQLLRSSVKARRYGWLCSPASSQRELGGFSRKKRRFPPLRTADAPESACVRHQRRRSWFVYLLCANFLRVSGRPLSRFPFHFVLRLLVFSLLAPPSPETSIATLRGPCRRPRLLRRAAFIYGNSFPCVSPPLPPPLRGAAEWPMLPGSRPGAVVEECARDCGRPRKVKPLA